jgi:hypothetical protein
MILLRFKFYTGWKCWLHWMDLEIGSNFILHRIFRKCFSHISIVIWQVAVLNCILHGPLSVWLTYLLLFSTKTFLFLQYILYLTSWMHSCSGPVIFQYILLCTVVTALFTFTARHMQLYSVQELRNIMWMSHSSPNTVKLHYKMPHYTTDSDIPWV